jgi:outer membrane protein TolC
MTHWKATLVVMALLLAALAGCSQKCCMPDCDDFLHRAGLPQDLPCNPHLAEQPVVERMPTPRTVDDPEGPPRYITLHECFALALEHGTVGVQSLRVQAAGVQGLTVGGGFTLDDLGQFNGVQLVGDDSFRVFTMQPALQYADIEASLSRYDAVVRTFANFSTVDLPSNVFGNQNGQFTQVGGSIEKALPTGGVANITFGNTPPGSISNADFASRNTNFYSRFVNPALPSGYNPTLSFNYSQPLLKFFGPEINSLLETHPLSPAQQLAGSNFGRAGGIVLARLHFDQSRAELERLANWLLLNVEIAYQRLYAAYVSFYSTDSALRQAYTAWKISKSRYDAGQIPITQFAQTRGQYEDFRAQRLLNLSSVLENERELRLLIGLKADDGMRLIPVDVPTVAKYEPDFDAALDDAMRLRPELTIARLDVKQRQLELTRDRNSLLPDVRLEAGYNIHGFGSGLDGAGSVANGVTDNALRDLASSHFADYNVGISAAIPLGFRSQHAAVRQDALRLAQAYLVLRNQEKKAQHNLTVAYRLVISDWEVVQARRAQREAYAEQVEARYKEFQAGKTTVDFLLEAQRQWADALSKEYDAIFSYNRDLVGFQFCRGTLLQHNNVQIADGPLPQCVLVRAVDHEQERAKAIACLERAASVPHPCCDGNAGHCAPAIPGQAPSVPSLLEGTAGPLPKLDDLRPNTGTAGTMTTLPTTPTTTPSNVGTPGTMTAPPALKSTLPLALPTGPATSPAPVMPGAPVMPPAPTLPTAPPLPTPPALPAPTAPLNKAALSAPATSPLPLTPSSATAAGRTGFQMSAPAVPPSSPPSSPPPVYPVIPLDGVTGPSTLPITTDSWRGPSH